MAGYVRITFQITGEDQPQRADVRSSLVIEDLIAEIAREFDIEDPSNYELYRSGANTPLDRQLSVEKQQVESDTVLVFTRPVLLHRRPLSALAKPAYLELQGNKIAFEVQWQPAIIGRPDTDTVHTALLCVNLDWVDNSRRVSRRHAQVTEDTGQYYIESLSPNNPTYLNKTQLQPGEQYPLDHNDVIVLRNSRVLLKFLVDDVAEEKSE